MKDKISKNLFAAAVAEGLQRANELELKIQRILKIIEEASDAVNSVYDDVKISTSTIGDSHYLKISANLDYKDNFETRRVMDIEIIKENGSQMVVTTRKGKTTVDSEEELVNIFQQILSSPTFWSGISDIRNRG
ncbi:hypothetical protein KK088_04295 [Enterobacter asburiae]|uniref:hypothetical protein n=1 Tax=Enterobacter TaxID=547 RepID=UPI001BDF58F5|nr:MULTISPECIES: hypothetical protein [Enterobacter]MBT1731491.1 hypothetical protein [Enterobacter asburiae]